MFFRWEKNVVIFLKGNTSSLGWWEGLLSYLDSSRKVILFSCWYNTSGTLRGRTEIPGCSDAANKTTKKMKEE